MEWFSWTVALILLISSVVSPWLVNKENNKHQLNLKKLDMYEQSKRSALTEFIKSAENHLLYTSVEHTTRYYSCLSTLFIYFSNIDTNLFSKFETYSKNNDYTKATLELTNIVQVLSKQIKKE